MKCGPGCEGGSGGFLGNRGEWEVGGGGRVFALGECEAGGGGILDRGGRGLSVPHVVWVCTEE